MRKIFYILIFFIIATSCGNQEGNDFVGKWVEKEKEGDLSEIIKNGKTYIVIDDEGKYPAEYKDGMLEISSPVGAIKATIDKQTNTLIIGGKEFIRYENSTIYKFVGKWKTTFFLENGTKRMDFIYKTGINGYVIIDENLNVSYEDFVDSNGDSFDANIAFTQKPLFGDINHLYINNDVLTNRDKVQLSITNDNMLKISFENDSDFFLLTKFDN